MIFTSVEFLIFLPLVFLAYWFVFQKNLKFQNAFILLASYVFYGWWDWRFLGLIIASSVVDYWCGLKIVSSKKLEVSDEESLNPTHNLPLTTYISWFKNPKFYLTLSLVFNLGLLGFFKYFNFFIDSATDLLTLLGFQAHSGTLNIILPVGISFYTFQTLSYTIDVYRGKMKPTQAPVAFFAYVSFFPQLVAGPIERASHLLPQFFKKREFDYQQGSDGMKLILWGFFKKVVIADNCALVVNPIFDNYQSASGIELIIGAVLFAFQIYGDFSGYSDIAIGTAKLFGFDLMTNFRTPYFSRDIAEFWRRWHISLSTWFRDYVYIPLGGSQVSKAKAIRNIFIVFLVSGFWHGANWTFIAWGGIHATMFIPLFIFGKNRTFLNSGRHLIPNFGEVFQIMFTFFLVTVAWVFFRSSNITEAIDYLTGVFNQPFFPKSFAFFPYDLRGALILFLVLDWLGRGEATRPLNFVAYQKPLIRYSFYYSLIGLIFWMGGQENQFIYFQF
ncbi:MBOAT family O-acyltransferase [Mongoliitalea lutea]|uniref:O-acyltransferase n=1 Tax=Mongoliitalea lutea TaxID=849756 RepID=A0A8J3G3R9_9BACT|nr:MBOAT family protein [Mongoliitalea lutea]GHB23862.1 O-acyltransferase [Mongoliitalea lutea]